MSRHAWCSQLDTAQARCTHRGIEGAAPHEAEGALLVVQGCADGRQLRRARQRMIQLAYDNAIQVSATVAVDLVCNASRW